MSNVVNSFKSFVIGNLQASPEVKQCLDDLLVALGDDLDSCEFMPSSDVDLAVEAFNKALIESFVDEATVEEDPVFEEDESEDEDLLIEDPEDSEEDENEVEDAEVISVDTNVPLEEEDEE